MPFMVCVVMMIPVSLALLLRLRLLLPSLSCMASLPLPSTANQALSHSRTAKIGNFLDFGTTHFTKLHNNEKIFRVRYKSYLQRISCLCKEEERIQEAVALLTEMEFENFQIGPEIYGELLQGCVYERAFSTGQQIHARILKKGDFFCKNEYIETKLVIFYAKCDILDVATDLFHRLRKQNVFSWAAMIGLHCRMGFNEEALLCFCEMHENGFFPDNFAVPNALKACAALHLLGFGKGVHGYALKMGFDCCVFVASSLVDMYGKCGTLGDARKVFNEMSEKNVVAWNSMIVSCVQNGLNEEAMEVFYDMRVEGIEPTRVTIASFLSASANLDSFEEGKEGHAIAVVSGLELDNILGTSLLNFYSKVKSLEDVDLVFRRMVERDVVTWNLLISSYLQDGQFEKAIDVLHQMRSEDLRYDTVTLTSLLSAFADSCILHLGKSCHGYCIRYNFESDVVVASKTVDMYAKCERIDDARRVFNTTSQKDLVLWNTLISAYAESGVSGEALKLFYQMQLEGVTPNVVSWNSVILAFLRNAQVEEAEKMFSEMQATGILPNLVTWTTLISGLAQNKNGHKAILFFQQMQAVGLRPNSLSIVGLLSACTNIASLLYGGMVHGYITRHKLFSSLSVVTSLVNMYAKCGSMDQARKVFDMVTRKELALYNAIISGHALHGQAVEALALFKQLQENGMRPDSITFTAVLSACSHAGLVDEGLAVFIDMISLYNVTPSMEHYGCVVSLLSRCGSLDEALSIILSMPFEPDATILGLLLDSCREHHQVELGEYLSSYLFDLEPDNSGNYVALSNTYAAARRWDEVSKLRDLMKDKGLRKNPGCSWVHIGRELHEFVAGTGSHPQADLIYETLVLLEKEMKFTGCAHLVKNGEMPVN